MRLIKHIFTHGKFYYSGWDFEERRIKMLGDLTEFCPPGSLKRSRKAWLLRNRYLRAWISEAAYWVKSFRHDGGHLALNKHRLWYIRIPRVASTALSRAILLEEFPGLKSVSASAEHINLLTDAYLQRTVMGYLKTTRVLTVVRNPYARIVSVYREFFEGNKEFFIYEDYLFGILRKNMSFEKFVETLQLIPDHLKDQHLRPQHAFLKYYERHNIPIKVIKLEAPGRVSEALKEMGLCFEPFNRREEPYDYRIYYTPRTRNLVHLIYREDFRRFDYDQHVL